MAENILCERKEQTVLSNLFEGLSTLLQDSDDTEEKERIKKALQNMTNTTSYMVLGEKETGKTSLLRFLFQDIFETSEDMTGDICEYRWGEQEFTTPLADGFQKKFLASENMRGLSIIDTKGLNCVNETTLVKIEEAAKKCDVILVVLDANHITSSRLWDIIESFPAKKMIFFLTKCDLISSAALKENIEKVKCYMKESNIYAPFFPISITKDNLIDGTTALEEVRLYIRENFIGSDPILKKQRENVEEAKKLLVQLQESFLLRKKQYLSDYGILQKINQSMDGYVANHKKVIADLIGKLTIEINNDIDDYEKEIISKLDPYKIKERFREKEDFEDYLNMVNENYKTMMNDSVNRKTIEMIKKCLRDLEVVFQEAVGYFNTRENILELNDRFYGSLSESRQTMVAETKKTIITTGELYKTLSDASETLFLQIWNERKKYDTRIRNRKMLSIGGSVTSAAVGGVISAIGGIGGTTGAVTAETTAVAAGTTAAGTTAAATATTETGMAIVGGTSFPIVLVIIIGVIVGAVAINIIAKNLYDPKAADKMEEATQKCIEQFKAEVDNTRVKMIEQISTQITEIFENELASVDGCFTDFRISVNIDEKKIPLLEQKLIETGKLLEQINNI